MAERNYPNDYFAWFNDDQRLAILSLDTTSTTSSERTTEKYDTFQGDGNLSGNITATNTSAGSSVTITSASHGLATDDRITISGTTSYDSNYAITLVDANSFTISETNSESDEGASSGVTWTSLFIDDGLRMTYKSKYETVTAITEDLDTDIGLDTSLQPQLVCYVKSRLYEDQGNMEQANYFRQMYEQQMMKQRSRKSGVRGLAVPNL
jgi:hypothetical protein